MNDWLWVLTAILAVLIAEVSGPVYQHVTRNHNQQQGEAR